MAKPKRTQRPAGASRAAGGSATLARPTTSAAKASGGTGINGGTGSVGAKASANGAKTTLKEPVSQSATRTTSTTSTTSITKASVANGSTSAKAVSAAKPSRLASLRERVPTSRANQNRRRYAVKPWWQGTWGVVSVAVVIMLLISVFAYIAYEQNQASGVGVGSPVPQSVLAELTHVPSSVFSQIGNGPNSIQMQGLPPSTPPLSLTTSGHPEIFFVGGEYCPYCAAERWGLVIALSRFGTFKNLHLMRSSHTDVYPDTATFTFYKSSYTSKYIVFIPVEAYDRDQNALQTLTSAQQQVFTTYDNTPYTQSPGSIPFTDYGGAYVAIGAPFIPSMLQGLSWQQIAAGLSDPTNDGTQNIIGTANQITATICVLDNQQPGSVCKSATIQQIEKKLPKRQ
ncbi:MAG TPA: DUF929 family protein [Ktedonobacterales bacterium]|nr:DUF929 family protein [Ktedonobacterales bacterium]